MGVLRLNGKAYGGGIDVIEVTQAQYNALPESKLSDDILYVISDSVNGSDGYPPLIYSTEEREVGVWIDGKPIYQKTVLCTANITYNTWVNTGVVVDSNADRIIGTPQARPQSGSSNMSFLAYFETGGVLVVMNMRNIDYGNNYVFYITVQYTKSTDTKGSGRWTTQGTLAQHYSTTERLIGTWIDGKPLYQKTINFGVLPNNDSKDVSHGISNVDKIWISGGFAYQPNGDFSNQLSLCVPYNLSDGWYFGANSSVVRCHASSNRTNYSAYVTLQYTKTTD